MSNKKESALARQEGGGHYKDFAIQPIEFIHANSIPFLEGNVIKYVVRHKLKNGIEDLKKAKHYIDLLIQLEYESGSGNNENSKETQSTGTASGTIYMCSADLPKTVSTTISEPKWTTHTPPFDISQT